MIQSGYLESEIWQDGFVDTYIWYAESVAANITSGSYNGATITAVGVGFRAFRDSGVLYYRMDGGAWVAITSYNSWSDTQIVGVASSLAVGEYDLKVVNSSAQESILIGAFSVLPVAASVYWTDYNAASSGDGSEANPWDLSQLKAYFNSDTGYHPFSGDVLRVKGDITALSTDAYIFLVDVGNKTITIKSWDIETNGIHTITTTNSGLDIFRIASSDTEIVVHDMVILTTSTFGPSTDPLVIVKSTGSANQFRLKGCMIISEENISMTGGVDTLATIYGSNISFGRTATFEINEYSSITGVYDSVINLVDTASINDSGGTLVWSHCETNIAILPGTIVNCTFDNDVIERMPTAIAYSELYENDFNHKIYDITNLGSGIAFWAASDIESDIKGYTRTGIGAFRFQTNTIYVSGDKQDSGDGTSGDALTMYQFRNYFNSAIGVPSGITPTGFDTFLMSGIFSPVDNFFVDINNNIGGYVVIKCDDILINKAWFIETKNCTSFNVFKFGTGVYLKGAIIQEFILTEKETNIPEIITISSDGVSGRINLIIQMAMYYCGVADISFSTPDANINLTGQGLTMRTEGTFISAAIVGSQVLLEDSVVDATIISDI